MGIKERSKVRRKRMVANRAANFEAAEQWDLDFWQKQTPQQRLSALVFIRKDILKVKKARNLKDE
jgi:hypothetical protein